MKRNCLMLILVCTLLALAVPACAQEGEGITVPAIDVTRLDIPDNEAMAFLKRMGVGWNLGNTFDAYNDSLTPAREMETETAWVATKTTEAVIAALHDAGFNTLRLPVTWHNHVDEDFTISEQWLNRVQEVVDWAVSRDMYVILNIHHDDGQKYMYPSEACYENSERYVTRIWEQLAARFADYDEHLIFESMNEPRLKGHANEWSFSARVKDCTDAAECINRLNQAFVNTVRAAGGQNAQRYLMVPAYAASPDNATNAYFRLPEDPADNRVIVSIHAYTPYAFALQDGGDSQFSLSSSRQTGEITRFMNSLYKKYIAQGVPVVIGEYGARDKKGNLQERVKFAAFYVASASARNIPTCWWDNGSFAGNGENFGLLRRGKCTWAYPEIVEAIMRYAGYEAIPAAQ